MSSEFNAVQDRFDPSNQNAGSGMAIARAGTTMQVIDDNRVGQSDITMAKSTGYITDNNPLSQFQSALSLLNGTDDYANGKCDSNSKKNKIAFMDDGRMEPLCNKQNTSVECVEATNIICAYPYVGPLSIQNNANFCEPGYEPSIWTMPKLPLGSNMNRVSSIGPFITKIDDSNNSGKPLWCVKRSAPVVPQQRSGSPGA